MHNESAADRPVDEPIKPSKLNKIKRAAVTTLAYGVPVVITGASIYYSGKLSKMQYDAAKLNLAIAKKAAENL